MTDPVTPERLMQMMWGFAPPLILEAALRMDVFDRLADTPRTVAELAAGTGASPRGLTAIMDALVGLGLLDKDVTTGGDARYGLTTESAAFLVSNRRDYRGDIFRHISTQLLPMWLNLPEVARTGIPSRPVNQEANGATFFQEFVESLFPGNFPAAQVLAEHLGVAKLAGPVKVLDLAAGSGVWSIAQALASPRVQVTAVDWPDVLPVTKRVAARHGVAERYRFVAGDILTAEYDTGYRLALLGHILHTEGPDRSRVLLRRVHDALAPGGTVAIAEFLVDADRKGPVSGVIFAVNMLLHSEVGGTYSFEEISDWLRGAGFTDMRTLPAPAPSPLVLATRPA